MCTLISFISCNETIIVKENLDEYESKQFIIVESLDHMNADWSAIITDQLPDNSKFQYIQIYPRNSFRTIVVHYKANEFPETDVYIEHYNDQNSKLKISCLQKNEYLTTRNMEIINPETNQIQCSCKAKESHMEAQYLN